MRIYHLFFLVIFLLVPGNAQPQFIGDKKIYFGASYYPEAWDVSVISGDIIRMKELHMNVVRMAEFSWALMEPADGKYDFLWLHRIIDSLHANGIDVILGTPTATPPAWLGQKYPDIYVLNANGTRRTHGGRRNCNYLDPDYIRYSEKIVLQLAKEFGKKPGVIGWQIDNEFNLLFDYSQVSIHRWHQWLQQRFGTIDRLNSLWCSQLWSQTYSSFKQVPMVSDDIWHHPSLIFNWYRFWNDMIAEYQEIQIKAIRKYSVLPITHDGMPGQRVDYEKLFRNLDFMAVNNYHSFEAYDLIRSNYDRMRGYGKGFYWLFETAPNFSGGGQNGNTWFLHQPDGSMRAALWMNYAMGGQGAMFWLWRQHWAGQEMPHGYVISSWNTPAANYDDIRQLGDELNRCSNFLMNHPVAPADIAVFWCHQNMAGLAIEEYANGLKYYNDWTYRFYLPVADQYFHRDVISPSAPIKNYKLLLMPLMPAIPDSLRQQLRQWVYNGGILILGPMSGYRTSEWTSFTTHALGDISEWSGIHVQSRIPVGTIRREKEIPLMLRFDSVLALAPTECSLWAEALMSLNGIVMASYTNGMLNGLPAIMASRYGQGHIVVLGTDPGKSAYSAIVARYAALAGCVPLAQGDPGAVIVPRTNGFVLVNVQNREISINTSLISGVDILSGKKVDSGVIRMPPFQVLVLSNIK